MYGIINQAIKEHVIANFGQEQWEAVKIKAGIDIDFNNTDLPYNDTLPLLIAKELSTQTGTSIDALLTDFGICVIKASRTRLGVMEDRGSNLKEYLINLPDFHNRIMLIYPALTPPEFQVTDIEQDSITLHYISKTQGLRAFVNGYLTGLMHFFNEVVNIEPLPLANEISNREVFKISW